MESRTAWQQQIKGRFHDLLFFYFKPKGVILLNIFTLFGTIAIKNEDALKAIDETNNSAKKLAGSLDGASSSAAQSGGKIGGAFSKASGAVGTLVSKVGDVAKVAGKTVVAGAAAGATAVTALAKSAVSGFAEYEQLVGGSQLLYGDAYETVQGNAQNAYKTVQMSQNEYLQQVNGFATGLKTALGGNEQAAAELAHKIIKAEADVVAATGNTQENVQNAFNGIMKSNFTMLDNLQLGITPTKEGFQEVINKVNDWNATNGKATKYQMGNLADMQSALVDYIEMVGLSDYANEEAAKTISGSTAAMKASWSNLLVGVADGNQDIGKLVGNFVDSTKTAAGNILPRIQTVLGGVGDLVKQMSPVLTEGVTMLIRDVAPGLVSGIASLLGSIVSEIPNLITSLIPILSEGLSGAFSAIGIDIPADSIAGALSGAFEGALQVLDTVKDAFADVFDSVVDAISGIVDSASGLDFFNGAFDGILDVVGAVGEGIGIIVDAIGDAFSGMLDSIGNGCGDLGSIFGGLSEVISDVAGFIGEAISVIGEVFSIVIEQITTEGTVLNGAFQFISETVSFLWDTVVESVGNAFDFIQGVLDAVVTFLDGDVTGAFQILKNTFSTTFDNIKEIGEKMFGFFKDIGGRIFDALKETFGKAKETASEVIAAIKDVFNVELSFPKIKLPHLSISGSFSFDPPSVPSISIEWYKKGGVMTDPTIFGFNPHTGSAMVGGEAGAEAIAPIDVLQGYVAQAVASQNADIVPLLSKIHDAIVDMSDKMGDSMRNAVDGMSFSMDNRKFGRLVKDVM